MKMISRRRSFGRDMPTRKIEMAPNLQKRKKSKSEILSNLITQNCRSINIQRYHKSKTNKQD